MRIQKDRRRWDRQVIEPPDIGLVYGQGVANRPAAIEQAGPTNMFVEILNKSHGGVLLKSAYRLEPDTVFHIQTYDPLEAIWAWSLGKVRWVTKDGMMTDCYLIGVEFQLQDQIAASDLGEQGPKQRPLPSDLTFIMRTELLRYSPKEAVCPILNSLNHKQLREGETLVLRGEGGDCLSIIQRGSCIVNVEENGHIRPVARFREGDILGGLRVLEVGHRNVHIAAETEMEPWALPRKQFDEISAEHPELKRILAELVANQLAAAKLTFY